MTMIEKVARAILHSMDITDGLNITSAVTYAEAAIEAMREPTEEMKEELNCLCSVFVADWNKIIDAALKE